MKTYRVELTAGRKSLAEAKIQTGIFQGDALLPLICVIDLIPRYHILRKCIGGCKVSKSQEKINLVMFMDNIKN